MARQALEGIKVADFSWALQAPIATKMLAQHGATVIKVESITGICQTRGGFWPKPGADRRSVNIGPLFASVNDSKYSMALDMHLPQGREIAQRLIAWSDIVVDNFTPGTLEKWGLGWEVMQQANPKIIWVSASMHGQTGPTAGRPGLGTHLQAEAGYVHFLGYPDGEGLAHVGYTDYTVPMYIVIAVMGALNHRRRTGEGMRIDLSAYETGIDYLGPVVLDYTANKRVDTHMGNRHIEAAPHGAYRCQGDDRWCVIAVFNDAQWGAITEMLDMPELAQEPRFNSPARRKENEDELDHIVEVWTLNRSPEEVMARLQMVGVPAGVVQNGGDMYRDPQLQHRQHFRWLKHPEMGVIAFDAPSFRMSRTPEQLWVCPCLGEHTEYVCSEVLGMSDVEFMELLQQNVFV